MTYFKRILTFLVLMLGITPISAFGLAGLAEWSILTPGGNEICFGDTYNYEQHGVVLRAAGIDSEIRISKLQRWRYYKDYVIGQAEIGFFSFKESTQVVKRFKTVKGLMQHLESIKVGKPLSAWLTPRDGSIEGQFFMYWEMCKNKSNPEYSGIFKGPFALDCDDILSAERRILYRLTTWGQRCQAPSSKLGAVLANFCSEFLASKSREPTTKPHPVDQPN